MNTEVTTIIDGYKCEFDGIADNGTTEIWISKDNYCGSVQVGDQYGCLIGDGFNEKEIPYETIVKIMEWEKKVGW